MRDDRHLALRVAYAIIAGVIALGLIANVAVRSLDRANSPPAGRTERFGASDRATYRSPAQSAPVASGGAGGP